MQKQEADRITGLTGFKKHLVILSTFCCLVPFLLAWQTPPGIDVKIQAQPQQATVGDPIKFDLDIAFPAGYQVTVPNPGSQVGVFEVLEFLPGPLLPDSNTPPHHRARVIAAAYRTGEFQFPPLRVLLRTADGKNLEISSPPVKIRVESVLTDKDRDLKGLKRQAEIQEPVRWILWFALAVLAVLLAAIAWWIWRRRRCPSMSLPPRFHVDPLELAEAELRDLVGRGLLEKGLVKAFYVALSEIVRRAIEAGYGIPTLEKTTSEILEGLRGDRRPAGNLDRIESLLLDCDLVKFAKYLPAAAENQAAIKSAFEVLGDCKTWKASAVAAPEPVAETT